MNSVLRLVLISLGMLPGFTRATDFFSFGGATWNQNYSPNSVSYLGEGKNLGGAIFSEALPQEVTRSVDFPDNVKNFNSRLTLGFLESDESLGARALNIPLYNDGSMMRHGVSLGWRSNLMIPNLNGPEFVIYESGEGVQGERESRGPELFMFRVRNAVTQKWTPWYHKGTKDFQLYGKRTTAGTYVTKFDLSELGLAVGDAVDQVQIANMVRSDTITGQSVPYAGKVLFTNPNKLGVPPRPLVPFIGSYEQNQLYGPDLLYVASLQRPMPSPFASNDKRPELSSPPKKLSADEARAEEIVVLLALEGQVYIFRNEDGSFLPDGKVFQNMSVGEGYSIVTGDLSAATLLLPDGAVLVLQPGSLLSLDRITRSDISDGTSSQNGRFTIHLIRGAFLLANKGNQGGDADFDLDTGRTSVRGSGGVIFFQMGEPLKGQPGESADRARKLYFELKTGMLSLPADSPLSFTNPNLIERKPAFAPPDINPSTIPTDFAPINLAFQNLAFLQNAIIPEGAYFDSGEDALAFFDPNKFFSLLIPGNNQEEGSWGGVSGNLFSDLVGEDGFLSLDRTLMESIANDPSMVKILGLAGENNLRLVLDGSGSPVFILDDGTQVNAINAPEIVQKLLADNPDLASLLDLSAEGVLINQGDDGLSFQLEDGGSIPGLNSNIQLTLDEDGNMVFLPDDGVSLPDVLPPGVIGDSSGDQMVIKRPEGNEGRLRRAHAQRVSQIQTSKAKRTVTTANQQRSTQASKASQQRAARDAQRRAQQAAQRTAQRRR